MNFTVEGAALTDIPAKVVTIDINTTAIVDEKYDNYEMTVLPESNVTITADSQEVVIDVYLEDNSTKAPVPNELVLLEFFNALKGTMASFSASTDANGHAVFNYTAPSDISDVNGTDHNMTFKLSATSDVNDSTQILFDDSIGDPKYIGYEIVSVVSNNTIRVGLQEKVIDIYLKDDEGKLASDERVLIDFFDGSNGTMNAFSGITDTNGHIIFNYTSPETVRQGDEHNVTFRLENRPSIEEIVVFTVGTNSGGSDYSDYNLSVVEPVTKTVTASLQSVVIDLYLEDMNDRPAADQLILLDFFNGNKGTMTENLSGTVSGFSGATDANGHAVFEYTAPVDISDFNGTILTFRMDNNTSIEQNVTINVDTNASAKDYTDYTISLVDVNRTITQSSQAEVFDVYLEDNSTGVAKPAVGDTIVVDFFDGNSGTLDRFSAVTDDNGRVAFTYTAPVDLSDLNGTTITFRVQNTSIDNNKVDSTFTVSSNASSLSRLQVATSSITLSQDAETQSVTILAFNGNGEAFDGGRVTVRYPDVIVDGNVSGGVFAQNSVDIVNGQAIFSFTGPDPLVSENPLNFSFVYSEDSDINTTLTVNYVPDIAKIVIDNGNTIEVTQNGEIVIINLSVYDKDNSFYPDGNIKIKYPDEVLTGKNVGSFDTTTAAVVDGKASFNYTAPNPLDGNDSIIFTFYHDAQPVLSEKDLNISIVPEAGQIVLTNYVLDAVYETSMNLDTSKGMTFYVEDDKGVRIDDANVTSMDVTVLNAELAELEDTSGNSGSSLSVAGENSVQMNLKSKTISGVVPVRVYSEFKDANNNDRNLTKVFNVVILSGAPTAMSLSYASTEQNAENAKFVENWVLTVTDKYNNLVNTTPSVSMGALIGYADDSSSTTGINDANYLYYESSVNDGNLTDANPDTFSSSRDAFDNVDIVNDKLVLFGGDGYKFNAYGKWDINDINASNQLELLDDFNGTTVEELSYAVGNNFRNEVCDGSPVVANVYAKDGDNILGSTGSMIIQVEYDYYLVGKSIVLWTNLVGENNNTSVRVGLGKKVTLRGQGLESPEYSLSPDYNGTISLPVKITNTVEYYKNARFVYSTKTSSSVTINNIVTTSFDENIYSCELNTTEASGQVVYHGGIAYVDVNVTADNSGGTIQLENIIPRSEF
ncbi:MAG: hypothetical protein U9N39_08630, partial [Campylobacterota bacterium]|nr:hypothetical protein [Campylobacterota bacterium]